MASRRGAIRTAIQNLLGGVSQQPNTVRLENQCEVQDNAFSSIVDGLGKRQPTEHVARLEITLPSSSTGTGLTSDKALIHWINRDTTERYAVVIDHALSAGANDPGIKVFDLAAGTAVSVTGKDGAANVDAEVVTYLRSDGSDGNSRNAKRDLKVVTIADTSYIVNRKVKVAMDHDVANGARLAPYDAQLVLGNSGSRRFVSKSARRWFLFQRTAGALSQYAVETYVKTGPQHPSPNTWDPKREDAADELRKGLSWTKTFSLNFDDRDKTSTGRGFGTKDHQPPYDPPSGLYKGFQIGTVQTHEVLRSLWGERSEGTYGTTKNAYYRGGIEANHNAFRSFTNAYLGELVNVAKIVSRNTTEMISELPQKGGVAMLELNSSVPENDAFWREEMQISVEASGDLEDSLTAFSTEVDRISQLPLTCKHGHVVKITGLADNDSDEFYAEFEANSSADRDDPGNFGLVDGHWKESMASLSEFRIDPATMPVKMVRVLDPSVAIGYRFEIYQETWADKTVGDEESNPNPSFVGKTIEDLFLWRNRLGIISGSRFIMSEADEFTNFWRTTVKTLLDSDPIDIDAGHSDVADLRFATPFEEELILWTDRTQFVVQGDPILTPRTAGLTPATEFEAYRDVRPEVLENGIFYALRSGGGGYSQIRQFHRVADASGSFNSMRSSEQIPRYITGKVAEMTSTSIESVLVVRTDDASSKHILYVYKWHDDGPGRRILSSWSRFLVGPSYSTIVHGIKFIDDDLYMIVERNNDDADSTKRPINLEKITFSGQRQTDTGSAFRCLLDRRITDAECTFDYDVATSSLDIMLPYLIASEDADNIAGTKIVSRYGTSTGPEGEQFAFTHLIEGGKSTLRVSDPVRTLYNAVNKDPEDRDFLFYVGQDYTMTYQFSRPNLRESRQNGATSEVATGRFQLLRGTIPYEDTGYMQVTISPALHSDGSTIVDRTTRTATVPMLITGMGSTYVGAVNIRDGRLQFGIRARPEHIRITLTNDSPYPCNPKGIEYESHYSRRSAMGRF